MAEWGAGFIWQVATCLFPCTKKHAAYVYKLEENVESLTEKWNQLQDKEKDVLEEIERAESTQEMERKNEVIGWLRDVQNLEEGMKDILDSQEVHSDKCVSGYCPKNCVWSYKLGKKIVKMLKNVDDLLARGTHFGNFGIAHNLPPKPVDEMPSGETVGLDLMVDKVWKSIEDDNVGIIGLYGMGGAGKTTLMKRIHNEFGKREHGFDLVLWVVVSRDCDINKIMNDIRNRLGIDDNFWNRSGQDQRVAKIYQILKQKKFVLMLDDMWGNLDLEMVGVPYPKETNNKSKVLFTTRSEDVCAKMQAQKKYKVECLLENEAFDLFCKKVGDATLQCHREIPQLAEEMAKECDGLPLALITVGSAMAGVTSVEAWRQARKDLMSSHWTSSYLEDKVFRILKFSYDKLPDEALKSCFLYCALYPEDYEVDVEDLIDRWIGEGFLGKDDKSIYDMYEQGESIIEKLKLSCLLEEGTKNTGYGLSNRIKMHDVIRDMALWLARDENKNKDKVLVQGEALAMSEMDSERLNVVERISIIMDMGSFGRTWQVPACPNLITLCLRFTGEFGSPPVIDYSNLKSMQRLKVFDLSTDDDFSGVQVPSEIGELINLEFLNLSGIQIFSGLPIESKLKNLRVFLTDNVRTGLLELIPLEVIGSLERLKVFRSSGVPDSIPAHVEPEEEKAFLEKLESLPKLEELCIQLTTTTGVRKLLHSTKLKGCSRKLWLRFSQTGRDPLEMQSLLASLSEMKHLSSIRLENIIIEGSCSSITDKCHLDKLRQVRIRFCNSMTHLTWLRYAPLLEFLEVIGGNSLEQVVKEAKDEEADCDSDIFPNLIHLGLQHLPKLESIHKRALAFPSLKDIWVSCCPNLRKLPINSSSAAKDSLISIRVETEWWNNLEWEDMDTTIKHQLHSKFRPLDMREGESNVCDTHIHSLCSCTACTI